MVPQKKSYNEGVIEGFWIGFEKGFKKALMEIANSPGGTSFVEWENRVLVVEGGEGTRIPQGEIRRFPLEIKMMNGKIIIFDGDEQLAKTYGGPKQISGRGLLKPDIKPYIEAAIDELRKAGVIPTDKS